jgi:hypothetical protein
MTDTRKAPAIRTDADALAWIAANRPHADVRVEIKNGSERPAVHEVTECGRCGGTGIYSQYHGTCFACGGVNSTTHRDTPAIDYARRERTNETNRARAAAKRKVAHEASQERQRDWCEANGFGRITFEEKNAIVDERRKVEQAAKRGAAPEGRFEFAGRVIKLEEREGFGGRVEMKMTIVVTAEDGTEWLAWGTAPRVLFDDDGFDKGATVKLTATVTHGREPHFAFFKRPTGAELVAPARFCDPESPA